MIQKSIAEACIFRIILKLMPPLNYFYKLCREGAEHYFWCLRAPDIEIQQQVPISCTNGSKYLQVSQATIISSLAGITMTFTLLSGVEISASRPRT